jgi:hypothetical protein
MDQPEKAIERRRSPRVEVLDRLQGHVRPLELPIALLNLSLEGFLMQASTDYPRGEIYEFRFSMADHDPIVLSARVVHTMRATAGPVASYLIGLEFVDRGVPVCDRLIESLAGRLPRLA